MAPGATMHPVASSSFVAEALIRPLIMVIFPFLMATSPLYAGRPPVPSTIVPFRIIMSYSGMSHPPCHSLNASVNLLDYSLQGHVRITLSHRARSSTGTTELRWPLTTLIQRPVLRRLIASQALLRWETHRRSRCTCEHPLHLMGREDKQQACRRLRAVQKAVHRPGWS